MSATTRKPVKFGKPPVVEVSCGVTFRLEKPLKSGHAGLYWSRVRHEFPRCEDAAPITALFETSDGAPNVQYEILDMPELRRTWLLNSVGTHLLQLQEDRFIFNWKRNSLDEHYPSYDTVIADFWKQWHQYRDFLAEQGLGAPVAVQLELTYHNVLLGHSHFLRDHRREAPDSRFLPVSEALNYRDQFLLPDNCGRLHVNALSARQVQTGEKALRLDLTARGLPKEASEEGCKGWFDLAHEWITHGFADLTTSEAHELWGRTA
ncbi:TIGR04255 family protein [Roseateles chitinivorans]|uniref:TIGR04255 family protein n=1 Tax=Roseateles chitinivorans TaxID=2917965 RepID=UPI00261D53CA|nr:TIGR04255 family protein [uncultured Roseateles sp.]